jgi:hypothetical protein
MKHPVGWDKPHSLMGDGEEAHELEPHEKGQTLGGTWGGVKERIGGRIVYSV